MDLDFHVDSIEKNTIGVLNCQIDLILRSLEFYAYTYQFVYPRRGKTESLEENLRKKLIRDTYQQITSQLKLNKYMFEDYQKYKEKYLDNKN